MLRDIVGVVCTFGVGAVAGVGGVFFWWSRVLRDPDACRRFLQGMYRASHRHWLQKSRMDATPVCPVCGWSETENP